MTESPLTQIHFSTDFIQRRTQKLVSDREKFSDKMFQMFTLFPLYLEQSEQQSTNSLNEFDKRS